jgi:hypothetical protein
LTAGETQRLRRLPYAVGGLSFAPFVGVIFGSVAVVWGLVLWKSIGKRLVIIGLVGMAFSFALQTGLYRFGFIGRDGIPTPARDALAQGALNALVPQLEAYKAKHGRYPKTLAALAKGEARDHVLIYDPTFAPTSGEPRRRFYYRPLKDRKAYYLLGVGADGEPYTADDILPNPADGRTGLKIKAITPKG